jgi:hypothetical protein
MFGFFKSKNVDPPSERQLNYARKLGIAVTSRMSKADVSDAISIAEQKNPNARLQREHINRKQAARAEEKWASECGPELLGTKEQWSRFGEQGGFILAIYRRGENTIVDVLQVNDAFIDGARKKKLKLCVASPKVIKDRDIGDYLGWERDFELDVDKLLYYEPLQVDFEDAGIASYQHAVEHGLKKAKTL